MSNQKALGQISYLIQLLTDRDKFVRQKVRTQLIELGEDALPFLEMAVRSEEVSLRVQAQEVISAIFPNKLGEKFRQLAQKGLGRDVNLEAGMLLIMESATPIPTQNPARRIWIRWHTVWSKTWLRMRTPPRPFSR